jgi:hypothetical protein
MTLSSIALREYTRPGLNENTYIHPAGIWGLNGNEKRVKTGKKKKHIYPRVGNVRRYALVGSKHQRRR